MPRAMREPRNGVRPRFQRTTSIPRNGVGPLLCFVIAAAAACADDESGPTPPTSGEYHHYVTTDLRVPLSAELQREYGLDLDNDPSQKPDNQLGSVFVALSSNSDADLQGRIDDALAGGKLVLLHSVRADALAADGSVSWQV